MEPSKDYLEDMTQGIWKWKSNPNPFSMQEKAEYQLYTPEQNLLLEKSYFGGKYDVDLEDWIISVEKMLQFSKEDKSLQRPIRRQDWMDEEENSSFYSRYCHIESPKPLNNISGSLKNCVDFFSKRNPEISDFSNQFELVVESNDLDQLNKVICPKLDKCISQEFSKQNLDKLKGKKEKKLTNHEDKLLTSFKKNFESLEQFFVQILMVYTLNTFLYQNLNKYLREEDWNGINELLPYAFCFCKAFLNPKLQTDLRDLKNEKSNFITLYRGTDLSRSQIQCFNLGKNKVFSWLAFTSASTTEEFLEKFLPHENTEKICRVIFKIQVPIVGSTESEYPRFLDISMFSEFSQEKEILLPPGSVFEFQEMSTDADGTTRITIKLKDQLKSLAYEGKVRPIALHSEMMTKKEAAIMCLEGDELYETLKSFSGNTFIEELKFHLCLFDKRSLAEMMRIFPTLKRTRKLQFVLCVYQDVGDLRNDVPVNTPEFSTLSFPIEIYEITHFYRIFGIYEYWTFLTSLKIIFQKITNQELSNFSSQGLRKLAQLKSLDLDFENCFEITDEGIENLSSGLRNLIILESLTLNFINCSKISFKGLENLFSERLRDLLNLKSWKLHVDDKIMKELYSSDLWSKKYKYLQRAMQNHSPTSSQFIYQKQARSFLNEDFDGLGFLDSTKFKERRIQWITERLLNTANVEPQQNQESAFYQSLKEKMVVYHYFNSVLPFDPFFSRCKQESSPEMKDLLTLRLQNPMQLTFLRQNFEKCLDMVDAEIKNLGSTLTNNQVPLLTLDLDLILSYIQEKMLDRLWLEELQLLTKPVKAEPKNYESFEDFINFLSGSNSPIFNFVNLFEKTQESNNIDELNKEIRPKLEEYIRKVFLNPDFDEFINRIFSLFQKEEREERQKKEKQKNEKILLEFKKHFGSFEDFFVRIVKIYTMDSFFSNYLNGYLRDDNLTENSDLLPYVFCLCKSFSFFKSEQQTIWGIFFRGTKFNEAMLQCFNPETIHYFSWLSFTSTTRAFSVARQFGHGFSRMEGYFPVFFEIRVTKLASADENYLTCLNVSEFSSFPFEYEVILRPRSVFKLLKLSKYEDMIIIHLEMGMPAKTLVFDKLIMPGMWSLK